MADQGWEVELEVDPVFEWRKAELIAAGVDSFSAFRLAAVYELDLHKLVAAAKNGVTGKQLVDLFID